MTVLNPVNSEILTELPLLIKQWGQELGFSAVGISDTNLSVAENHLAAWIAQGFQGEMDYMHKHGIKRSRPALLHEGTRSIISVRMDYLPEPMNQSHAVLTQPLAAFISRYALGRDYHKVLRQRLQTLADKIQNTIGNFGYRAFVDSAPVLEKAIAEKAGLGWIGKHSNLIHAKTGSWFFLGEIYTDLPLTADSPAQAHCGHCTACLNICPTRAIVAPYQVDARRCISYLTIELHGAIPVEFRPLIGNRIYGCDDCQLICPWNRFAQLSKEADFNPRYNLNSLQLLEAFSWHEVDFLKKMEGSAIRRIGHERWLRNIAIALGNAKTTPTVKQALIEKQHHPSEMVREHVKWALTQHTEHSQ
jgi:epoxyqueuosine reductase